MAELSEPSDTNPAKGETPVSAESAKVPPKRLGWLWTVLLLLILPAVAAGLWYGGTRHRVEDHPKKVKPRPRRLPAMQRPTPAARPMAPEGVMK